MKLRDIIVSKVRVKILALFLLNPREIFYVRQIVRGIKEEINAVRRELGHLEKAGLLASEKRGNRLYYRVRTEYPIFYELTDIVNKTFGLGGLIRKKSRKLGKVKYAMLSGKYVRGLVREKNEIDLLIVGDILTAEIARLVSGFELKQKREINYTVMSEKEFGFRKKRKDPFIVNILSGARTMVIGDEEKMVN